jgi:hypothetical protein
VHSQVTRFHHLCLAPVELPILEDRLLQPDGVRHWHDVFVPVAAEENRATVLPGHDGKGNAERVANRRGFEEVNAGAHSQAFDRTEKRRI